MIDQRIEFSSRLWRYSGKTAWYFITLPQEEAKLISFFHPTKRGFGSVKVRVKIGEKEWKTSIFPDKKSGSYLLPIKKEVRQQEALKEGAIVNVALEPLE